MSVNIADLRQAIARANASVPAVSAWSVGMHVHHCGLAMTRIWRALEASTPPPPPSKVRLLPSIILRVGRIPRGRGKATEAVVPSQSITTSELTGLLDDCERQMTDVARMTRDVWFQHPVFGVLGRDETLRFVRIHNRHHLRIIEDILAEDRRR